MESTAYRFEQERGGLLTLELSQSKNVVDIA